jgi:hypothetical protein
MSSISDPVGNDRAAEELCALTPALRHSKPFRDFLGDLVALGSVPCPAKQGTEFGVVGSRSNERYWLIPVRPRSAALAGLALFQPVTGRAALLKSAAVLFIRLGLRKLWARERISLDLLPLVTDYFDRPVAHLAFFTGTDGPHRKSAIEFIDARGDILGYAKVSRQRHVAPYIRTEAQTLSLLKEMDLVTADVPMCLAFKDDGTLALIVTDSRKSRRSASPRTMKSAHRRFLIEIAEKTRREADKPLREGLAARLCDASAGTPSSWKTRFARGISLLRLPVISMGLAHGDFTPWNCFLDAGRLYVFDWEYADASYPLGYDVMKFHTCQMAHNDHETLGDRIITETAQLYFDGNIGKAQTHYHLALLVHSGFYIQRARIQGDSLELWPEHVQFAALIDVEEARAIYVEGRG